MERFIADAMLGRLARWMRMLGYDTLYYPDIQDRTVMSIARQQQRIILTRDSDFHRKGVDPCLFVRSDHVAEQLSQVVKELSLSFPDNRRCPECNGELATVSKRESVRDRVPEYVYHTQKQFRRCTECGHVYWEGTHARNFSDCVRELFPDVKEEI